MYCGMEIKREEWQEVNDKKKKSKEKIIKVTNDVTGSKKYFISRIYENKLPETLSK